MRLLVVATATAIVVTACSAVNADPGPAAVGTGNTPTTTSSAGDDGSIRLLFTGDMLPSDDLQARAAEYAEGPGFDFMPMLAEVAPIIGAADWAVCHQETPVSDDDIGLSGYPQFNAPFELAEAERAVGYDACSTASNHTVDLALGGIEATLETLDRFGIRHTGSARTQAEHDRPTIYDVEGVQVGHLAYAYGLNGLPAPAPWAVNLIDPAQIRSDAAALRQAGADIVVVSLHFGEELDPTPSAYQEQVVADVMRSPDVDLIVGHHAHVVQPIQRLPDGRWVLFGLGNFLAQQSVYSTDPTPRHRDGVIVEVTFAPSPDDSYDITQVGYVPTFVDAPSDVVQIAPEFSRARTEESLHARGAPLVDLTP